MAATKLQAKRGATFRKGWVWYAGADAVKAVTVVTLGFPTILTAPTHGLPATDIPVSLISLGELTTKNEDGEPSTKAANRILAKKIDADTFSVPVDTSEMDDFTGGFLVYTPPKNLTGYAARMQFRTDVDAADPPFLELTDLDGIALGGAEGTIDMVLTDTQTTDFEEDTAVWNIELIAPGPGDVTRFDEGTFELSPDVNRPTV